MKENSKTGNKGGQFNYSLRTWNQGERKFKTMAYPLNSDGAVIFHGLKVITDDSGTEIIKNDVKIKPLWVEEIFPHRTTIHKVGKDILKRSRSYATSGWKSLRIHTTDPRVVPQNCLEIAGVTV